MPRAALILLIGLAAAIPVPAAPQHALAAGGPYDPAVPTPAEFLGHELGARFTPHHRAVAYIERVAAVSDRVRVDTVARTHEGRAVLLVVVTSEANQGRLEAIRADARRLADPRGVPDGELDRLAATAPVVVWLGYTVHGDEASGVEAALGTIYQLAAGQDEETRLILDRTVALIDPMQNPDGHERHVSQVEWDRGVWGPDPHPAAVVHGHDWHGGRTNHYLFDMNRDWILHSQPETRGRMAVFRSWYPHVAADLHEMGSNSTYFFAPPMAPVNANVHPLIHRGWQLFSRGNAEAFSREGWGFFTREGYDEFFPGYGPSWPIYTGAIGMTYEQGSSEGGAIRREDGTILTLLEAARHHYTASRATLLTAARNAPSRLADYLAFRRDAPRAATADGMRTVVLERDDAGRSDSLVATLRRHGIEARRTTRALDLRQATAYGEPGAARVRVDAGSWVIDLAQPQGVLARTLLEPDPAFDPEFIREELERREAGLRDRFYDMTGWALPFLFRVRAWWTPETVTAATPVEPPVAAASATPASAGAGVAGEARYAYAFHPGSQASLRLLAALLADSIRVRHAPRAFRAGGVAFPRGAFLVQVARNAPDVHQRVRQLAGGAGLPVVALHGAMVEEGADLGSNSVRSVAAPRVALAAGDAISPQSYGAAWFAFDHVLRYPVTRMELEDLVRHLRDFDVVVLPSAAGLDDALGEEGRTALAAWVRGGGTLITFDAATAWLAGEDGLARLRVREDTVRADGQPGVPLPGRVPGAILRAVADTMSPLLAGVEDREVPVMLNGPRLYEPPTDVRPGEVVMRYAGEERLRLAGYLWPEVPARVAGTPYLWTERLGRGRLIAFTADPTFRSMWPGLLPLFANAVFLGGTI